MAKRKKKKKILPKWVGWQAEHFNKKGLKSQEFANEAYVHGFTPGRANPKRKKKKNPYTTRLPKETYKIHELSYFSSSGYLFRNNKTKSPTSDSGKLLIQNFKSAVSNLTQMYVLNILNKKKSSDFNFSKGMPDWERKQVVINQYHREVIGHLLLASLKLTFKVTEKEIKELLKPLENIPLFDLRSKTRRSNFRKQVQRNLDEYIRNIDLVDALRPRPKRIGYKK